MRIELLLTYVITLDRCRRPDILDIFLDNLDKVPDQVVHPPHRLRTVSLFLSTSERTICHPRHGEARS